MPNAKSELFAEAIKAIHEYNAAELSSIASILSLESDTQLQTLELVVRGALAYSGKDYATSAGHFRMAFDQLASPSDEVLRAYAADGYASSIVAEDAVGGQADSSHYFKVALNLFESLGHRSGVSRVTTNKAISQSAQGNLDASMDLLEVALKTVTELQEPLGIARVLEQKGYVQYKAGAFHEGAEKFLQSMDLYTACNRPHKAAHLSVSAGVMYVNLGEFDKALKLIEHGYNTFSELNDNEGLARATLSKGNLFIDKGEYAEALALQYRALELFEVLGDASGMALCYNNIGNIRFAASEFSSALEFYHRALRIHEDAKDNMDTARVLGNIGSIFLESGDYVLGLEYYTRALDLFQAGGNQSQVGTIHSAIGNVYYGAADFKMALQEYQKAYTISMECGNVMTTIVAAGFIGNAYADLDQLEEAEVWLSKSTSKAREIGARRLLAYSSSQLAEVLRKRGRISEALALLENFEEEFKDEPKAITFARSTHALILSSQGDHAQAIEMLNASLAEATTNSDKATMGDTHKQLCVVAKASGDFDAYILHNDEYLKITNEIKGSDIQRRIAMQESLSKIEQQNKEHEKQLAVLHSTLPKHIADRVARGEVVTDHFDNAAVLFLDVVGFTNNSALLEAGEVVELLQNIFTTFDSICAKHNITKIKTIGDSYMAVAFPGNFSHVVNLANAAIDMINCKFTWSHNAVPVEFRIGLHCGSVVAGVLGTERMQYDVWGDTVNVASRMESSGEPGQIHVSEAFANASTDRLPEGLPEGLHFMFTPRGEIEVKGKGQMKTFWLESVSK